MCVLFVAVITACRMFSRRRRRSWCGSAQHVVFTSRGPQLSLHSSPRWCSVSLPLSASLFASSSLLIVKSILFPGRACFAAMPQQACCDLFRDPMLNGTTARGLSCTLEAACPKAASSLSRAAAAQRTPRGVHNVAVHASGGAAYGRSSFVCRITPSPASRNNLPSWTCSSTVR